MTVLAYVLASEDRISDRMLAWRPPRWVRLWMLAASRLGDGWIWCVAAAFLSVSGSRGLSVLRAGVATAVLANAAVILLKGRVRRPRPGEGATGRPFDVGPLGWFAADRYSFPSGHALNAFAVGSLVALSFPTVAVPVLAVAASVAASRVVLGLHWLSDVIAGTLGGALIGSLVWLLLLR